MKTLYGSERKMVRPTKDVAMAMLRLARIADETVSVRADIGDYHGSIAGDIAAVLRALEACPDRE
jgi:hypothetical protein